MYKLLPIFTIVTLLCGCDFNSENLSVKEISGKTYLLDQDKKQIFLISEDKLIELKRTTPTVLKDGQIIQNTKNISSGRIAADVKIKFLGNKALYHVDLSPVIKTAIKDNDKTKDRSNHEWFKTVIDDPDSYKFVSLNFQDSDGFNLFEHTIWVSEGYTRIIDENGEIYSYRYSNTFPIDSDKSKHITKVNLTWSL